MDTVKSNNEPELTSTMGNVLSTSNKDEKNDTSDATPTSSTDANTTSTASQIVSDDPISSTSTDIVDQIKTKTAEGNMQNSVEISEMVSDEPDKSVAADHEADLLEMSISNVPNEKITEDVEDLVHDLESLLGESTDSFNVPIKRREDGKCPDVKEVVDTPLTSVTVDQEILLSGNLTSNKADVDQKDDTSHNEHEERHIVDILPKETEKVKSVEDELEDGNRSDKKPIEYNDQVNKNQTNTEETHDSGDISSEPQPTNTSQTIKEIATEEPLNIPAEEKINDIEDVTESVVEHGDVAEEQLQNIEAEKGGLEKDIECPRQDIPENIEEECLDNNEAIEKVVSVDCKENKELIEDAGLHEDKIEKEKADDSIVEKPIEDLKSKSESTAKSEHEDQESLKDNQEPDIIQDEVDPRETSESNTESPETLTEKPMETAENMIEDIHKHEDIQPSQSPDRNAKGESSGDQSVIETENKEMDVQHDSTKDVKADDAEISNDCTNPSQISKESLNEPELRQDVPCEIKEVDVEDKTEQATQDLTEVKDCAAPLSTEKNVEEESVKGVQEASVVTEAQPLKEVEEELHEQIEDKVQTGEVSNVKVKGLVDDKTGEKNKLLVEECDIKTQEEPKGIQSPKDELSECPSSNSISESQKNIPEPTEVVPEQDESTPEVTATILDSENLLAADQDASDLQSKPLDSPTETPVDIKVEESPHVETTEMSDRFVIEDEPVGIVSEPEQVDESTTEVPDDSKVEIVEITEDMAEKMAEDEEIVGLTVGQEKTVGIVTEIPDVVDSPEGAESENVVDVSIEDPQPETESEAIQDVAISETQPEFVPDTVSEEVAKAEEQPSEESIDEESVEVPQIAPEDVKIKTDSTPSDDIPQVPEVEMQTEDKSNGTTDIEKPEIYNKTPKSVDEAPSEIPTEGDESKMVEQIPTSSDDSPPIADSLPEQVEPSDKTPDDSPAIADSFPEQVELSDKTPNTPEETPQIVDETSSINKQLFEPKPLIESVTPVDEVISQSKETPELVDETPTTVDEPIRPVDDIPSSVVDEASEVVEKAGSTDDAIDEAPMPLEEAPGSAQDTANAIMTIDEIPISSDEIPQPVDEKPSSSDEALVINDDVLPSDDIVPIDDASELDNKTPEQVGEASKVVVVDDSSESVEEIRKDEELEDECTDVTVENTGSEAEAIASDQNLELATVPESPKETEGGLLETREESKNRIIEISDDESKLTDTKEGDYVQILSSGGDSDGSEEMVPVLALEPDENNPSPKEPIGAKDDSETEISPVVHSMDVASVTEPLPEIEEILADQCQDDEVVASIDMQENLETILAVASLQTADSTEDDTVVEPPISEKEKREMEALRKAVESITENPAVMLEDDVENVVEELINDANIPIEDNLVESLTVEEPEKSIVPAVVEEKLEVIVNESEAITINEIDDNAEKIEQAESDTDQDVPELRIEDSEDAQDVDENVAEENCIEVKEDVGDEQTPQSLPDTSENERKKVLPDSSQIILTNEERQSEASKETKSRSNERPRRHKKSISDNKLEELSINVDVPDKEKPYSPKVTIKPIRVPDDEVSTTSNSDSEVGKGSLKMTITKQSDKMHSILKICDPETSEANLEPDEPIPKLIIKSKMQQVEQQHSPKMSTRSSKQMYSPTSSTQRSGSPRITIKPVVKPEKADSVSPLKIKIKTEDPSAKKHNPKLNIKPIAKPEEESPSVQTARKVIIKPVVKPGDEVEQVHSPRITIKPIPKPESEKECLPAVPRLNIKPIKKQDDEDQEGEKERSSPKITIKPIVKPPEPDTQTATEEEEVKERIVLKINKGNLPPTPTKETKKREHPPEEDKSEKLAKITVKFSKGGGHPHIVQQPEESNKRAHEDPSTPEKTKKLKTDVETPMSTRSKHKENVDSPVETRSKHKELTGDNPSNESSKLKQKDGESPSHESSKSKHKDPMVDSPIEPKRAKLRDASSDSATVYESTRSRHKETPEASISRHKEHVPDRADAAAANPESARGTEAKLDSPIVISEDSRSQDSGSCVIVEDVKDPLSAIPVFEIRAEPKAMTPKQEAVASAPVMPATPSVPVTPTPRKRGRPRKVPIVVREEFKEQEEPKSGLSAKEEEQKPVQESGRPKRSCRGQSVRATLGIKPRKPRGPGRGRGSKRGMGTRAVPMKPEGEPKLSKAKLKLMQQSIKEELAKTSEGDNEKPVLHCLLSNIEIKAPAPVLAPPEASSIEVPSSPSAGLPVPSPQAAVASPASAPAASPRPSIHLSAGEGSVTDSATPSTSTRVSGEIVMVDEETRMSADTNSRAQTPAKQVPTDAVIEESQSSVQSTATTESGKAASSRPNKAPRLEVQEPEGAVISADQLTEYYWNGNGPFMLQEQVAQFLGIKSFKRKYPGIMRRMLDMQERDFIREGGLASEHMCDLGLTAVNSADILDIMYSDFQEKYEEYCKHQRDRQAKDLINKQRALSLAASQEKNKADITEQAVQSAAQWNASFNKARREQRKACMDLQTLTVHYPRGKIKQINKNKVGNYPVALVPGQFTDYYKEFTPTEINNMPINTMCYDPINIIPPEESEDSGSDGSDSDSDSSSSSSGSGSDSSSGVEDCKLCKHSPKKVTPTK